MPDSQSIRKAAELLKNARNAVALTGAGISTPSGIPDFRSPQSGVWEDVDPMEVATIQAFVRDPSGFYGWIRPLADKMRRAVPNAAHLALAQMETAGFLSAVITQNIDMLHTRAGSREVYEVHGHMREATCVACYQCVDVEPYLDRLIEDGDLPRCPQCNGSLKPNVVLLGEQLPATIMLAAERAAEACDVMLVAGSSLMVTPVAGLPYSALGNGARLIIVNYEPTYVDDRADVVIRDDVATVLPRMVEAMGVA